MYAWENKVRRIALGSDHAGFKLKESIKTVLQNKGIEAVDMGTNGTESVDYPDFAEKVARVVSQGSIPEGILICGTGIGMSITANKFPNVRAAVAPTVQMAKMSRAHNDSNILCLGERVVDEPTAKEIVTAWLDEPFEGGRHERRVNKIKELDRQIVPLPKETK
jgi:ribose 5-phosphate isomerase B